MKEDFTVKCPHCDEWFTTVAYIDADTLICNECDEEFPVRTVYSKITKVAE